MSDFVKAIKKNKGKPISISKAKKLEREEQSEGIAKSLKAGKGNIVSGTKKRHLDMKKDNLGDELQKAAKKVPNKKRM